MVSFFSGHIPAVRYFYTSSYLSLDKALNSTMWLIVNYLKMSCTKTTPFERVSRTEEHIILLLHSTLSELRLGRWYKCEILNQDTWQFPESVNRISSYRANPTCSHIVKFVLGTIMAPLLQYLPPTECEIYFTERSEDERGCTHVSMVALFSIGRG